MSQLSLLEPEPDPFTDWLLEEPDIVFRSKHVARWYQDECQSRILTSLQDNRSTLAVLATGLGKCLGRGTPVLLYSGRHVPVEDITAGMLLMGPDSKPRRVLSTTEGHGKLFRIIPKKGEPWVCNWCHVLTLKDTITRQVFDIPLDRYLQLNKTQKHRLKLFSVPIDPNPLLTNMPIDPYILGVWLGDGTKALTGFQVSKPDVEIVRALEDFGRVWGLQLKKYQYNKRCPTWALTGIKGHTPELLSIMRRLFPNADSDLRVPTLYLQAAASVRRELLAGLIDTDGYVVDGCVEIVQKRRELADDIALLARSLGLRVTEGEKIVNGCTYRRLVLSGDFEGVHTRIARKQLSARMQKKDALRVGFDVESLPDGEFFGFELDGDGRFLLGDLTVTHNTQIFSALARDWDGPVLVLAHRDELVQQARERLELLTGEPVEIEQGEWRSGSARLVVGSVQTVYRKSRLERMGTDRFSLVIADEAHHYVARTYRRPLEFFKDAKVVGFTATPDRGDAVALGKMFDDVAYVLDIVDGIRDGWLVRIEARTIETEEIDLSRVTASRGDLQLNELDDAMLKAVEPICQETLRLCPERQGIGFFPGVRSAELAMHKMNALRPGSAAFVSGETDPIERRRIMEDYRKGRYQFLMNCQIATEGFDAPNTSCIILGRPTKSRALAAQMAGRGTRVLPGLIDHLPEQHHAAERRRLIAESAKPDMILLDFVGNAGRHKGLLVTPTDILGGNYSDDEVKAAKKLAEKEGGGDVQNQLEQARAELKRLAQEYKAKVKTRVETFNPFEALGLDFGDAQYAQFGAKPLTDGQRATLKKFRLKDSYIDNLSKRQASRLIDKLIERRRRGLASLNQVNLLKKWGVDDAELTFENANRALDYLKQTNYNPNPIQLSNLAAGRREPRSDG